MKRKNIVIMSVIIVIIVTLITITLEDNNKNEKLVISVEGMISAGGNHTVALKNDGTVYATGKNVAGQCDVSEWADIIQVSAGVGTTLGLRSDGTVVATGRNDIQDKVKSWTDIVYISAGYYAFGVTKDGRVVTTAENIYEGIEIDSLYDIKTVSESFTTAILIGENDIYSLVEFNGIKPKIDKFISSSGNIMLAQANTDLCGVLYESGDLYLKNLGAFFGFGRKRYQNVVQFDLDLFVIVILKNNGEVKIVENYSNTNIFTNMYVEELNQWNNIISVDAGDNHCIGLKSDGTIVAVGNNDFGQCDVEEWDDIATEQLPTDLKDE